MSRVEDLSRALTDSFEEYDETLRQKMDALSSEQVALADHILDANDDHLVTKDQVGLSLVENYSVATMLDLTAIPLPERYVDMAASIAYIRANSNLARVINTGDPIYPIANEGVSTVRPKLRGGQYDHAYGIDRLNRTFQMTQEGNDWTAPRVLDVVVTSDDLTLPMDLDNYQGYKWRYRDTSVDNLEGVWKEATFQTQYEIVLTPTITLPDESDASETSLTPRFQGSPFTVNDGQDTHLSSTWRVYDDTDALVVTKTVTTGDLTQWVPDSPLPNGKSLRVELEYTGASYEPSGVAALAFQTTLGDIVPPTITAPEGATDALEAIVAWSGTYPLNLDTHAATWLQVARDAAFTDMVVDFGWSSTDKTQYQIDRLRDLTTYYLRAKVRGESLNDSDWSDTAAVTTGVIAGLGVEVGANDDVVLNDGSEYALGGYVGSTSPTPAVFFRDSSGQIYDQSILALTSGDGEVIAVEAYLGGTVALVRDNIGGDHQVLRYSDANVLLWSKRIDDVVPTALVCTDQIYIVGHTLLAPTTDFFNTSGRITALDALGESVWSTVIGGIAADTLSGATATSDGLAVVGQQTSNLGSTIATQAGVVVFVTSTGLISAQRSYGHATDIDYRDVARLTDDLFMVVGQIAQSPAYFVMNAAGDILNHRMFTSDHDAITSVEAVDSGSVIVSLSSPTSHALARLYTTHTVEWGYSLSETVSQGSLGTTSKGLEWISSFVSGGSHKGVVLRLPKTGGLSTLPYSVDCEIAPVSLVTTASTTGIPVDDVGPWGDWVEVQLGSFRVGTTTPPNNQLPGTVDTPTQEYKDHFWANGGTYQSGGYGDWNEQSTEVLPGSVYVPWDQTIPYSYEERYVGPSYLGSTTAQTARRYFYIDPVNTVFDPGLTQDNTYSFTVQATSRNDAYSQGNLTIPQYDNLVTEAYILSNASSWPSLGAFLSVNHTLGYIGRSLQDWVETSTPGTWELTVRRVTRGRTAKWTKRIDYRTYAQRTYRYYPKALTRTRVYEPVLLEHTTVPTTLTPQQPSLQPTVPITQIYSIF